MLFMDIMTWDKKDDREVVERYAGWKYPEGYNVVSVWTDLSSCRVFIIYDINNGEDYAAAAFPWRNLIDCETIPLMETPKAMEIYAKVLAQ
jgi:hypothetical protein